MKCEGQKICRKDKHQLVNCQGKAKQFWEAESYDFWVGVVVLASFKATNMANFAIVEILCLSLEDLSEFSKVNMGRKCECSCLREQMGQGAGIVLPK